MSLPARPYVGKGRIWNSHTQRIRFMQWDPPSLENKVIYLLTTQPLTFNAKQELERLFEVFGFAKTLCGMIHYPHAKSITCKDCHSYKALCDKLVTFIKREEEEGDFWFDKTESLLYELEDPDETRLTLDLDNWDELKKTTLDTRNNSRNLKPTRTKYGPCLMNKSSDPKSIKTQLKDAVYPVVVLVV